MQNILIGVVKSTQNKVEGYRVLEVGNSNVMELEKSAMKDFIKKFDVEGVTLESGKITANVDRYPIIVNNLIQGKAPLIVLGEIVYYGKTVAYKACDWYGYVHTLTKEYAVNHAKTDGIVNGELAIIDGEEAIRPIKGDYEKIEWSVGERKSTYLTKDCLSVKVIKEDINGKSYRIDTEFGYIEGSFKPKRNNHFWIDFVDININHQRQGIATLLYDCLEDYIKANNITGEVRLGVVGTVSTLFWKSRGFEVMDYMNDDLEMPESAIMVKHL